jgi:hypothetical protein
MDGIGSSNCSVKYTRERGLFVSAVISLWRYSEVARRQSAAVALSRKIGLSSRDEQPFLSTSDLGQRLDSKPGKHYVRVKIPETILAGSQN